MEKSPCNENPARFASLGYCVFRNGIPAGDVGRYSNLLEATMEAGEKAEMNVRLSGLSGSYPVIGDTKFDLELRPEAGGTVVVERTMPDIIDTVMNLN